MWWTGQYKHLFTQVLATQDSLWNVGKQPGAWQWKRHEVIGPSCSLLIFINEVLTVCFRQALGGLAYQAFYQRILSASSYTQAQVTCFASSAFCLVLGIPSVLVGAVAASTGTMKIFICFKFGAQRSCLYVLSMFSSSNWNLSWPDQQTQFNCLVILIQTFPLPCQTGTPPPMACPPHTIEARRAQSCPLPCSFSHLLMCPSLVSELLLLPSCRPWIQLFCPQPPYSLPTSIRT